MIEGKKVHGSSYRSRKLVSFTEEPASGGEDRRLVELVGPSISLLGGDVVTIRSGGGSSPGMALERVGEVVGNAAWYLQDWWGKMRTAKSALNLGIVYRAPGNYKVSRYTTKFAYEIQT